MNAHDPPPARTAEQHAGRFAAAFDVLLAEVGADTFFPALTRWGEEATAAAGNRPTARGWRAAHDAWSRELADAPPGTVIPPPAPPDGPPLFLPVGDGDHEPAGDGAVVTAVLLHARAMPERSVVKALTGGAELGDVPPDRRAAWFPLLMAEACWSAGGGREPVAVAGPEGRIAPEVVNRRLDRLLETVRGLVLAGDRDELMSPAIASAPDGGERPAAEQSPAEPVASSGRVRLYRDGRAEVDGIERPLTDARRDVVRALVDAHPERLSLPRLIESSGRTGARNTLKTLSGRPGWSDVIDMAGQGTRGTGRGRGYGIG